MGSAGKRALPVDAHGLNERDRVFVAAYARNMDGARAAREAFPDAIADYHSAARTMLMRPEVLAAVEEITTERRRRYAIDAERVLREFAAIGFADIRDVVTWGETGVAVRNSDDLTAEQAAAISEITETTGRDGVKTIKVKMHPKVQALEALGKNLRLFGTETNVNLLVANLTALPDDVLTQRVAQLLGRNPGDPLPPKMIEATVADPDMLPDIFAA